MTSEHISVCICTFKRPALLQRLLAALATQQTDGVFTISVVVCDNDREESARAVVEEFGSTAAFEVKYIVELRANIALARNRVIGQADGDYIALIDDDEFPVTTWLRDMLFACKNYRVAGVLGPVLPHFETAPPSWLIKSGFYDRPRHKTGERMRWQQSRTGNVLFRSDIIRGVCPVFDVKFGEGGEDVDFFRRMNAAGCEFIWCDEAIAYEAVPTHRWTRRFLIHRAFLRGQNTFRQPCNRWRNVAKSLIAAPVYALTLPFLLLAGQHWFMRYLIRFCDHAGRLLAVVRLNPVAQRRH